MPLSTLNAIKYPFEFEMTKDDFLDLMSNSGRYSEIIGIKATPEQVEFLESSEEGSGEVGYDKEDLPSLKFLTETLLLDSEIEKERIADKKIFDAKQCVGYYSLTYLRLIKEFCNVLSPKDKISFSLKSNHPLKTQITFKKLSNALLDYYLAPRGEKDEEEEDDFEEHFEPTDNEDE